MDQTTADSMDELIQSDPELLKPGHSAHLCRNCPSCSCTGNGYHYCCWDCNCPSYYQPEEKPL
jgi:hypothetical protein